MLKKDVNRLLFLQILSHIDLLGFSLAAKESLEHLVGADSDALQGGLFKSL